MGSYTCKATPAMADTNPNLITTCSRLRSVQSQNTDQPMSLSVRDRNAKVTNNAPMQYTAPCKCHIQRTNACTHHNTCCWLLAILRGPLFLTSTSRLLLLTFETTLYFSLRLPEKNCQKTCCAHMVFPTQRPRLQADSPPISCVILTK